MNQEDLADDGYQRMDDKQIENDIYLIDLEKCKKYIGNSLTTTWN